MEDENGNRVTFEEWEYQNKIINYKQFDWAEENPIDIRTQGGDKLANYRQTVPEGVERKAILFFVHGYGDNVKNYAYLAKLFAENGIEFCGMDQSGFGLSEG